MSPLIAIAIGLVAAAAAWAWSLRGSSSAEGLSIAVVLAVLAVAFNVVQPVSNVEATTLVVICLAMTLGPANATLAGAVAVLGSGITGGVGIWTAWQITGFALVALIAAATGDAARGVPRSRTTPVVVAVLVTVVYDLLLTATSVSTLGLGSHGSWGDALAAALLLGLPYSATHIVANAVFAWVAAPPLLRSLRRASARLAPPVR